MSNLPIVTLTRAVHRKENQILIGFKYNGVLIDVVRRMPQAKWSNTLKSWHVDDTNENLAEIYTLFKNKAEFDDNLLVEIVKLSEEANENINHFMSWLKSKRYSPNTIKTYVDAIKSFLKFYATKPVSEITNQDVITFNNDYILAKNYSASFQNQVVNALKLFFITVQNKTIDVDLVHRPKRPKLLPNVLSKEEVKAILDAPINIKHKTMLSLIYACGLRRSELLNLKPEHINSKRNILIIKQSKGKKDRITPISDKLIGLLRDYYKLYKPKNWLFEGQKKVNPIRLKAYKVY